MGVLQALSQTFSRHLDEYPWTTGHTSVLFLISLFLLIKLHYNRCFNENVALYHCTTRFVLHRLLSFLLSNFKMLHPPCAPAMLPVLILLIVHYFFANTPLSLKVLNPRNAPASEVFWIAMNRHYCELKWWKHIFITFGDCCDYFNELRRKEGYSGLSEVM
jgi:hypothetical protein